MSGDVAFVFELGSRYSYPAASQVPRFLGAGRADFGWMPIVSPRLIEMTHSGATPFERAKGQYQAQIPGRGCRAVGAPLWDCVSRARAWSLGAEELALACWCCEDEHVRRRIAERIFQAVFEEVLALTGADLARLAAEIGVIGSTGPGWPSLPDAIARHDAAISEVHARGAFGVPSFFDGDELFFGNDRLVLLEDRLTGRSA